MTLAIFYLMINDIKSASHLDFIITVSYDLRLYRSSVKMKYFAVLFVILAIFAALGLVSSADCPSVCRGEVGPDGCPSCSDNHTDKPEGK